MMSLITAIGYQIGSSQNLVPNPGFEVVTKCPVEFSKTKSDFRVVDWWSANPGTPDYFQRCSADAGVPNNWAGSSEAFEGSSYAGIFCWMKDSPYREFIQCKLVHALQKDSSYIISFRYRLSSYSKYVIDRLELNLSEQKIITQLDEPLPLAPTLHNVQANPLLPETGSWQLAEQVIRAKGGEQYLTIGNFADDHTTGNMELTFRKVAEPMLARGAYYYIDDVQVVSSWPPLQTPSVDENVFTLNETYVLHKIQFQFDSYKLQEGTEQELDSLVRWLLPRDGVNIVIHGHTDDAGSDDYNLNLSKKRAQSVADYLISHGIVAARIETAGYGKRRPIEAGADERAREVNRRVEFVLVAE